MSKYFPIDKIPYRPFTKEEDNDDDDDVDTLQKIKKGDYLCYRYYNKDEVLMGKTMAEWCRFSICFWHTLNGSGGSDPFGSKTLLRPWDTDAVKVQEEDTDSDPIDIRIAKRRVDVLFDLLNILNIEYYTFHDTDIAPEGKTMQETFDNLDIIVNYIIQKQQTQPELYGHIKLLWATQNLFSHSRYRNGAMTNPHVNVYCQAAAQIQKVMDVNYKLRGQCHVFWGGREGYQTLLNTNIRMECDHMAQMYHMAIQYKTKMNYTAQFLIEPKPCEPMKHQYDYDAATTIAFLYQYQLQNHFLLNIEPNHTTLAGHAMEHDIIYAAQYHMLGSIDANIGDTALGWDTDQFPMNVTETTAIMQVVIQMGGFMNGGGLNFDCKVRRESIQPMDLIYGHLGAIDTYAYGLRKAVRIETRKVYYTLLQERYQSWTDTEIGQNITNGTSTLEECTQYAIQQEQQQSSFAANDDDDGGGASGQQELYEIIRNTEIHYR
jgi:xylose isomerase